MATVDPDGSSLADHSTLQQRFEASRAGKIVISVFIVVFVGIGVIWNLPDSPIGQSLRAMAEPIAAAADLDQNWGLYATPLKRVSTVEVHVTMADGQERVWTTQTGELGVGWWDR